jgi:hypothetical protein
VIAVGVPALFVLGWALPLLGVPLLGFLVVDLVRTSSSRSARPRRPALRP